MTLTGSVRVISTPVKEKLLENEKFNSTSRSFGLSFQGKQAGGKLIIDHVVPDFN